jgi:hypothetical protein
LLLMIVFCALDLAILLIQAPSEGGIAALLRRFQWNFYALGFTCLSFLYPLFSADRSRAVSNLHAFALHKSAIISSLVLYGISPFDTRSKDPLINLYRLGIYALLFVPAALAASGLRQRWRLKCLRPADSMLFGAAALWLAIPILPPTMNGSDYFSPRLMIFPWLAVIAAAGAYTKPERLRRLAPAFALVLAAITLLAADIFFRPVSHQLATIEAQSLPKQSEGLAMLDPAMLKATRIEHQLGFNPYLWSGVLPFIHENDIMLNSPWMDLTIMPVKVVAGSDLMVNEMSSPEQAATLINGNIDLTRLTPEMLTPLIDSTKFIVYVAVPKDVRRGLAPLLPSALASRYACTDHNWYLVCTK